jgi:hypothetical protein
MSEKSDNFCVEYSAAIDWDWRCGDKGTLLSLDRQGLSSWPKSLRQPIVFLLSALLHDYIAFLVPTEAL